MFFIGFVSVRFWTCLKDWTSIIFEAMSCENSCTCFRMYLRKALLDQFRLAWSRKLVLQRGTWPSLLLIEWILFRSLIGGCRVLSLRSLLLRRGTNRRSSPWLYWWSDSCVLRERPENSCLLPCKTNSPCFEWAQKLVRCPPLSDCVSLSVVFLSFELEQNTVHQMKRWGVLV